MVHLCKLFEQYCGTMWYGNESRPLFGEFSFCLVFCFSFSFYFSIMSQLKWLGSEHSGCQKKKTAVSQELWIDWMVDNLIYHTKYGVIKDFLPREILLQNTWKNTIFFHVYLLSPISSWHITRLSRHSVR